MEREKDRYLKVATPEQWDYWLTLKADANASYEKNDWHVKEISKLYYLTGYDCLFCKVFGYEENGKKRADCESCMGNGFAPCLGIPEHERVDRAIERLEKIGIWD
jgi:hypothetical protein